MELEFSVELINQTDLILPVDVSSIEQCVISVSEGEQICFSLVEVVFVTEEKIVEINTEHLGRTYITDIITFDYTDEDSEFVEGTLFCCASRIVEQAAEFSEPEQREYHRIIVHGLLHLCGYSDETDSLKSEMTKKEDFYLEKLGFKA